MEKGANGRDRISLRKLAKRLGVSQPFLSQIKQGHRPLPEHLKTKLNALDCLSLVVPQAHVNSEFVDIAEVSGSSPLPPTTFAPLSLLPPDICQFGFSSARSSPLALAC